MKINSKGVLIISIIWIIGSPIWLFWIGNTAMGIVWLCVGIIALIGALIRRKKEKNE
jgi:uncharacterized membrane protein HdeD (DUF308 family)